MFRKPCAAVGFLAAIAAVLPGVAGAQAYPDKPIRFVVAFPPGSGIDTVSRLTLEEVRKASGATIVVDNRPGALGQIGTDATAKSAPDGYTVMASSSATHSSGPQLAKKLPYDAIKDFTHVGLIVTFNVALLVRPGQAIANVAELIAEAKRRPDALTFGYGSATAQVTASAFNRSGGIRLRGVPYKGQPAALNDLLGGQIDYVMVDLGAGGPHLKSGKLVALGIAAPKRSALLPSVPTFTELGFKDVELQGWVGVAGPAGMRRDAVEWWSRQLGQALARKELVERLQAVGFEPEALSGEPFNAMVRAQFETWGAHIRAAGIEPE
jgi:tripartite-type tricarboxylate transporter receptor subunit TctC